MNDFLTIPFLRMLVLLSLVGVAVAPTRAHAANFAPGQAGVFTVNLLNGTISRVTVSYSKEATATNDQTAVLVDFYGNLSTSFQRYLPSYAYDTGYISSHLRLQVTMEGDSVKRFKECMAALQGNQDKNEVLAALNHPAGPWAQLEFYVDPTSTLNSAAAWNVVNGTNVTVFQNYNSPQIWFRTCTTNM